MARLKLDRRLVACVADLRLDYALNMFLRSALAAIFPE